MSLKLQNSWDSVYTDQFIEIRLLDNSSIYNNSIEIISILNNIMSDDELFDELYVDELNDMVLKLSWIKREPSNNFKSKVLDYEIIDINKLTFGEFLDLEYLFSDYYTNFNKICATFYRKVKEDEWGIKRFEPYPLYDIDKRALEFDDVIISDVWGIIKYYLDLKKLINDTYDLFEPEIDEEDVELDEEDKVEEEKEKVFRNWAWENVLHNLSNGDITRYNEILDKPIIFILNQLSFRKDMKI